MKPKSCVPSSWRIAIRGPRRVTDAVLFADRQVKFCLAARRLTIAHLSDAGPLTAPLLRDFITHNYRGIVDAEVVSPNRVALVPITIGQPST